MRTLAIQDGDLVLGTEGFTTVGGYTKLVQEMSAALREPLGVDRFHPTWGSLLPEFIGHGIGVLAEVAIRSEIYRVLQNYISMLAENVKRDTTSSSQARYGADEIIKDIQAVEIRQELDRFHIRVSIVTLANASVTLVQTVRP